MTEIEELDLPEFDILLLGDGSGSTVATPCGWFVTMFTKGGGETTHFGGTNGGTNNYAELAPYLHALWRFHVETFGNDGDMPSSPVKVVIVSDSEVTVRCGNKEYARRANGCLWAQLAWFERNGYAIYWRHVARNTTSYHARADSFAG
jgi:ribonuclease HI